MKDLRQNFEFIHVVKVLQEMYIKIVCSPMICALGYVYIGCYKQFQAPIGELICTLPNSFHEGNRLTRSCLLMCSLANFLMKVMS